MDCADCARKVASALEEVPGVVGAAVALIPALFLDEGGIVDALVSLL